MTRFTVSMPKPLCSVSRIVKVAASVLEDVADAGGIELEDEVSGLQPAMGGHLLQG